MMMMLVIMVGYGLGVQGQHVHRTKKGRVGDVYGVVNGVGLCLLMFFPHTVPIVYGSEKTDGTCLGQWGYWLLDWWIGGLVNCWMGGLVD